MNSLIEILQWCLRKHRRAELIKEVRNAQQEYQEGRCQAATPSEIMKEILLDERI
jgi:hypothetical protein